MIKANTNKQKQSYGSIYTCGSHSSQDTLLCFDSFLFTLTIIYINYNYPHIYWISIHIELESSSKTYMI